MKSRLSLCCKFFIAILGAIVHFNTILASDCGCPVLQLGGFTTTLGRSQHINIEGLIGDDFSVKRSSHQNFLIGLGYYFYGLDLAQTRFLYGINAFYLGPTKVKGKVTQEDLFTNLAYHYSRANYPIYFATKAFICCGRDYDVVIDLGIGPNIARTRGFKERSLDGGITIPDHIFKGKSVWKFSATAGIGWRMNNVLGNLSVEIDYRFFYLGQGELKKINNQVKNSLYTGHSYANAILFTIDL